ncbi:MAG: hypothetical protein LBJ32_02185 [Oscillospiraceae bacterium]|jgi:hypothetical protein|nr:hypothetical protein [Oscillospiraceae bacterium]
MATNAPGNKRQVPINIFLRPYEIYKSPNMIPNPKPLNKIVAKIPIIPISDNDDKIIIIEKIAELLSEDKKFEIKEEFDLIAKSEEKIKLNFCNVV